MRSSVDRGYLAMPDVADAMASLTRFALRGAALLDVFVDFVCRLIRLRNLARDVPDLAPSKWPSGWTWFWSYASTIHASAENIPWRSCRCSLRCIRRREAAWRGDWRRLPSARPSCRSPKPEASRRCSPSTAPAGRDRTRHPEPCRGWPRRNRRPVFLAGSFVLNVTTTSIGAFGFGGRAVCAADEAGNPPRSMTASAAITPSWCRTFTVSSSRSVTYRSPARNRTPRRRPIQSLQNGRRGTRTPDTLRVRQVL